MDANARTIDRELRNALWACSPHLFFIGVFSATINILALTSPLYMLQIYDRVISGKSIQTLIGLSLITLVAYLVSGILDAIRGRMLARTGALFDEVLTRRIFDLVANLSLRKRRSLESLQPIRDIDQIRGFLSGTGPAALFDLPFLPMFLLGCFLLHPWLGMMALSGCIIIIALTLYTENKSHNFADETAHSAVERHAHVEAIRRNAEAVRALGMRAFLVERVSRVNNRHIEGKVQINEIAWALGAFAKTFRIVLQSGIYGLGTLLIINGEVSAGAMIAGSIMMSRALAPLDIVIANWRGLVGARQSYHRLQNVLSTVPEPRTRMVLTAPVASLNVTDLYVAPPDAVTPIIMGVTLQLRAGQVLKLTGPSGAGKSTLARALVGVWPRIRGEILLDGVSLEQWDSDILGRHIGYLPQDVELFEGTVAENISRFQPDAPAELIIKATKIAGAHEMVLRLANGYNTWIGEGGTLLSGGHRQRIALARAMYGDPFLVVLDEPNANLDEAGRMSLKRAIYAVRERGGIIVVITHDSTAVSPIDAIAVMEQGRLKILEPHKEIVQAVMCWTVRSINRA
jgi:ATP-binding cassette subfamily C protein